MKPLPKLSLTLEEEDICPLLLKPPARGCTGVEPRTSAKIFWAVSHSATVDRHPASPPVMRALFELK
eukprot:3335401-Prymnesium_polylepis.1